MIILVGCATTPPYSPFREISLETPNCPIAECRLKYEGETKVWRKKTPESFSIDNVNKNLFVACFAKTEENEMVQSIIVKPGDNDINHPIDCSILNVTQTAFIEQDVSLEYENLDPMQENLLSSEDNNLKSKNSNKEIVDSKLTFDSQVTDDQTEFSLNESILQEIELESEEEDNTEIIEEESQEDKIFKENIAQKLLDQIESLYKQGLITKEAYEIEKEIIKNMNN
tara:strand:+ start:313 stop:993 length:681 start_codon:yes stop_codon:yes gene_type:complete